MSKARVWFERWQRWLSFSVFTLAGMGMEGGRPPLANQVNNADAGREGNLR